MPVIQLVIMAFALTTDVTNIRTAVLDMDRTPLSRELIKEFTAGGYFEITQVANAQNEMAAMLDKGEVRAVLHIPSGFEQTLSQGRSTARVQVNVFKQPA